VAILGLLLVPLGLAGCASHAAPDVPAAASGLPPPPPGKGAIAGLLIDDIYRPVPGGLIFIQGAGLTATTDSEGQFAFLDLEPGSYVLIANAAGHEAAPLSVDVQAGQYADAEIQARRLFGGGGSLVTEQYSVLLACGATAYIVTSIVDCIPDQSGDSNQDAFTFGQDLAEGNATAFVLEMKASQRDGYAVSVDCGANARGSSWEETFTDYIRTVWAKDANLTRDGANGTQAVHPWSDNCTKLYAELWYLGSDPGDLRKQGYMPWGVGVRFEVRATFLLSLFVGPPQVDLQTYHLMSPTVPS